MGSLRTASSPLEADFWRMLAWIGVLLIAALLVFEWMTRQSPMMWALAIFLVAGLGIMQLKKLPSSFLVLLVLSALLNGAGGAFEWFEGYFWFDEVVHLYSGFAGLSAIGYLYARHKELSRARLVWWCTGMGLALGVGWEVIEELMGDLEFWDTLSDILMDIVGSALGGFFAWHALRARRRGSLPDTPGSDRAAPLPPLRRPH